MHCASRLSRARMYIGVGWLFCVTLPAEIRYGIGVRMCAPSMPLPSPPSTRLSRVAPQDACFCTSVSGTPYLAKIPFSLATNSGAASVSAMKPSLAPFTSGPAPCANAPEGNCVCAAPSSAAVPALALRNDRRLMVLLPVPLVRRSVVMSGLPSLVLVVWVLISLLTRPARVGFSQQKSRSLRREEPPQDSGVAMWPFVGPDAAAHASA